jgi:hypothetical protein
MKTVMLLGLVITAACSKTEELRPPAKTGPPSDGVELVTIGDMSATRVLRYQLVKGAKSQLELAMNLDMDAGGRANKMPTLAMTLEIVAEDVLADGNAKIRTTVVGAEARARPGAVEASAALAQMSSSLVGITFTATLSPSGRIHDSKVDTKQLPSGLSAQVSQLTQNLEQVAMPLPLGPVGVGAKWTTRKTVQQEGLEMVTITTVELTAMEGNLVTFASTSTISAKDQTITNNGMSIGVKDVGGGGHAKGTIDLSRMTMTGQFDIEFRGTMSAQGQTAPMKMAMGMTMKPVTQGAQSAP